MKQQSNTFFAHVPVKEHSERIPGKNIKLFNGKPLFYWIFKALSQSRNVETIILDTDSEMIAGMVGDYFQVEVSIRPEPLRGDFVSVNKLIAHVMSLYPGQRYFLQTHVTNPLLTTESIDKAIDAFLTSPGNDSLFSVTPHYARFYTSSNQPVNHNPGELLRTQDLEPLLEENSNLYIFSRESFNAAGARIGRNPWLFHMNPLEALDVDEEEDFILAETIMKHIAPLGYKP